MADTLDRSRAISSENSFFQIVLLLILCVVGSIVIQAHKVTHTVFWLVGATSGTYLLSYFTFVFWGTQFHLGVALIAELLIVPLGQLQQILVLQALIGDSLVRLKTKTQGLPLHLARILERGGEADISQKKASTDAEWKLNVIAQTEEKVMIVSAFQQSEQTGNLDRKNRTS